MSYNWPYQLLCLICEHPFPGQMMTVGGTEDGDDAFIVIECDAVFCLVADRVRVKSRRKEL